MNAKLGLLTRNALQDGAELRVSRHVDGYQAKPYYQASLGRFNACATATFGDSPEAVLDALEARLAEKCAPSREAESRPPCDEDRPRGLETATEVAARSAEHARDILFARELRLEKIEVCLGALEAKLADRGALVARVEALEERVSSLRAWRDQMAMAARKGLDILRAAEAGLL